MPTRSLRGTTLACCALSTLLFTLACGTDSDKPGSSAGSGGTAAGGPGDTGGAGGTSSAAGGTSASGGSSTTGGTGGSTGTTTGGSSSGGTTGGSGGSGGSTAGAGGGVSAGGSAGATAMGGGAGRAGGGTSGSAGSGTGATGGGTSGSAGAAGSGGSGGLTGAVPSQGCGSAAPTTGALQIDVGGTMRDYILRLPEGYDASVPHRIIFAFHGMSGSADQVDKGEPPNAGLDPTGPYYGIKDESSDTIFVAGQALSGGWTNSSGRDIDYVKALVAKFEGELCIDQSRMFATGFSFGAIMTITVGCNMADVFRAIAPMSGSLQNGCPASEHSIAYWASHGNQDTTIVPAKGEEARDEFVKRNHCAQTTHATTPEGCIAYEGCADGYPVTWCPFDGIHQPPPFSGPAIWSFLSQF